MLTAVRNQAIALNSSYSPVTIVGCSSLKWSCWGRGSSGLMSSRSKESAGRYHVTVSAAKLDPGIQVGSFETAGDSLPPFPPGFDLAKAVMRAQSKHGSGNGSTLTPQFLLFSHSESDLSGLRSRLDKLFRPLNATDGACLASAAGTLSSSVRKTAVLNPHAPIGMNLSIQPQAQGSDIPLSSFGQLPTPEPMAFFNDSIQRSSGCTGLIFYPSSSPSSTSSSSSEDATSGLSPSSSALMARVLLGQDRFASLELNESTLSVIRPPPTSPGQFLNLQLQSNTNNTKSAPKKSSNGLIKGLPLFEIGRDFLLFPGQVTQMRIFEKRYQFLMRQLIETDGILGFPIGGSKERGITAVVQSYLLNGAEFYVAVEGLGRYESESNANGGGGGGGGGGKKAATGKGSSSCRVLPSSFGLTAVNARPLIDDVPQDDEEVREVMNLAKEAVRLIHEGASLAMVPQRDEDSVKTSSLFLSALHLSGRSPQLPSSSPGSLVAPVKEILPNGEGGEVQTSSSAHYHPRLQSQLAERAIQALEKRGWEAAMDMSLLLGGVMPVEAEARKAWFSSLSTVQRLRDQVKRLRDLPNLRLASSVDVLRLERVTPYEWPWACHGPSTSPYMYDSLGA